MADDDAIRAVVKRLARPHPSGGDVVERSMILAEGGDFAALITWITAHAGVPDASTAAAPKQGLHGLYGSRVGGNAAAAARPPLRYVLPAGVLS